MYYGSLKLKHLDFKVYIHTKFLLMTAYRLDIGSPDTFKRFK